MKVDFCRLLPNDTYKTANMNYSFSLVVKCVPTLQFCRLVTLFHDGHYSKSLLPNTWLLCCRYVRIKKNIAHFSYDERLKSLTLRALTFRRISGDIIEVYKILSGINDVHSSLLLNSCALSEIDTRGNKLRLTKLHCHYDLRKYSFTNIVISSSRIRLLTV